MDKIFRNSILAGIIIGFGANAYLFCGRTIFGAAFFSLGIILIMMFQLNLYTGAVPATAPAIKPLKILLILFGNCLGASLIGACENNFLNKELVEDATKMIMSKPDFIRLGLSAIFCGIIVGLIVLNKTKYCYVMAIPLIVVFIKSGFEHSIAYCFYMFLTWKFNPLAFAAIVIGNWIGGYFVGGIINENRNIKIPN